MVTQVSASQPAAPPSRADESLADALAHLSAALALLAPHRAVWLGQLAAALDRRRLDPTPAGLAPLCQGLAALDAAHTNLSAGANALNPPLAKGA